MIKIIKDDNKYFFLDKNIRISTPNGNLLNTDNELHANLLLNEMTNKKKLNDPFSIISLTFFSCDLSKDDRKRIKIQILDVLKFDTVLYRCFSESDLKKLMEKKWDHLIDEFDFLFDTNLYLLKTIMEKNNLKKKKFEIYLDNLDNYFLTVFFKLSTLTKSTILSYFFIIGKIDDIELYKLSNIEYTYQQKRWGVVQEQKKVNQNTLKTIKNISFFFKNVN